MQRRICCAAWLVLSIAVMFVGCGRSEPDRWAPAQEASSKSGQAVAESSVEGAEFNRFFPQVQSPWDIVFKQEKTGFVLASLQTGGREVAQLSVSDTNNNPSAVDKYRHTQMALGLYPKVDISPEVAAILVGSRFQVRIQSMDPSFGSAERGEWLNKFDLDSISRIK